MMTVLAAVGACGGGSEGPGEAAVDSAAMADSGAIELGEPACSAAMLEVPGEASPAGLPNAVAETRRAILRAAIACDYDRLEELALRSGSAFAYSFGDANRPAEFWRGLEAAGEDPLAMLVRTLALPWAREELEVEPFVFYVWPSAFLIDADEAAWAAVEGLYTPEEIETMREYGGFIGYRVGVTENGEWRFFVAGD